MSARQTWPDIYELAWKWDPIGLGNRPRAFADHEYECIVDVAIPFLIRGSDPAEMTDALDRFVPEHFGFPAQHEAALLFAQRAKAAWSHVDNAKLIDQYGQALDVLRAGGIVALPTDTVYGLVAVASDRAAVERVYEVKARDPKQPLPLFVASVDQAELIAEVNDIVRRLMHFWPGALTIVLRKKASYDTRSAAGGDTIGVRMPRDPVLRELATQLGPLTGTSANVAGREECHTAADVRAQLGDAVDLIVDASIGASGRPSTIVDCSDPARVHVLRDGAIGRDALGLALAGVAEVV